MDRAKMIEVYLYIAKRRNKKHYMEATNLRGRKNNWKEMVQDPVSSKDEKS